MERDGWIFVGPALGMAFVFTLLAMWGRPWATWIAVVFLVLIGAFAFFFRDPSRKVPEDPDAIVAPADGKILVVKSLNDGRTQIDTFLSVFDVHVNRSPVGGQVVSSRHAAGRFHAAMRPEAATANERQDIVVASDRGVVRFAQIAGVLARRIVCRVHTGDLLKTGERIGLIRFGSRMEVIIPGNATANVRVGDRVRAGESIIARFDSPAGTSRSQPETNEAT